jgi:hypothetical protein
MVIDPRPEERPARREKLEIPQSSSFGPRNGAAPIPQHDLWNAANEKSRGGMPHTTST